MGCKNFLTLPDHLGWSATDLQVMLAPPDRPGDTLSLRDEAKPRQPRSSAVKNSPFIAILLAILLLLGILVAWYQVSTLGQQIDTLTGEIGDLSQRLGEAEIQTSEAESRANLAEEDAEAALRSADEALLREQLSAEQAAAAERARRQAEEREMQAAEARQRAEAAADQAAIDRATAREEKAAAERRKAEAILEADRAWGEAAEARAEATRLKRRMQRELDRMQSALERIAQTRREGLELVMTLDSSQVEFDFNKAELRIEDREVLSRLVGVLLTFDDYGLQIFGHTDDVGSVEYNEKLSEQRAQVVKDYLVDSGIDESVIKILGMGKSSPLVEGTDDESRQRNRRVEVGIVFSEGDYESVLEEDTLPLNPPSAG